MAEKKRLWLGAALVLVIALVGALVWTANSESHDSPIAVEDSPISGQAPQPTAGAGIDTGDEGSDPDSIGQAIAELPAKKVSQSVATQDGLKISVTDISPGKSDGSGAGEIAGSAVVVTIKLTNTGRSPYDLSQASVAASLGSDRTPASPLATASESDRFGGQLQPGRSVTGTYVFLYPNGEEKVYVEVAYAGGQPLAVFQGKP